MQITNSPLNQYNVAFGGLFKKREKAVVSDTVAPQDTSSASSSAFKSVFDSGIFSKAKLYLNNSGYDYTYLPIVNKINALEASVSRLSDEELKNKTAEFKEILSNRPTSNDKAKDARLEKEALDSILPEAYAVVREASKRVLGKRPYDVQLLGAITLHNGKIAEMRTGEGKTLTAALPAYLNALTGKGVHVITANNYLAERDAEITGKLYNFLGMSVGVLKRNQNIEDKKQSYNADITYGTNVDIGFDYLHDNMVTNPNQCVQRPFNFAVIDEVDNILIDKATNSLVKGSKVEGSNKLIETMLPISRQLKKDVDYTVDEKSKNVILTEEGEKKAERLLGILDLYNGFGENAYILRQTLIAKELYHRDKDYIIRNGQAIVVDQNTGYIMPRKRLGVHQEIEAKEGLKINGDFQAIASITMQNLFNLYSRISGMTGTAMTEKDEFENIYGLQVSKIPTNMPDKRLDLDDEIYKTEDDKYNAVIDEIVKTYNEKRPVLVGTTSIKKSEMLSEMLKKRGIPHNVLNAKDDKYEAQIVAQAGRIGAVTIATNMAGRGTNILLGGDPEFLAEEELKSKNITPKNTPNYEEIKEKTIQAKKEITTKEHDAAIKLGGLYVIGTEKHESARIDNQLRGRAARQGEPGTTKFYVSMQDDLMRIYGGEEVEEYVESLDDDESLIEDNQAQQLVDKCQKKAESAHFSSRKRTFKYDCVINIYRQRFYKQRREILENNDSRELIHSMIQSEIDKIVESNISRDMRPWEFDPEDLASIIKDVQAEIPQLSYLSVNDLECLTYKEIGNKLKKAAIKAYKAHEREFLKSSQMGNSTDLLRDLEKSTLLKVSDGCWIDYLNELAEVRKGVGLMHYAKKKPLLEFQFSSSSLFDKMVDNIRTESIKQLYAIKPMAQEKAS